MTPGGTCIRLGEATGERRRSNAMVRLVQTASDPSNPREFKRLADQGHARGTSRAIGEGFIRARDLIARGL